MYADKVLPYCTNILDGPKLVYLRTAQRSPEHQRQHFGFQKREREREGEREEGRKNRERVRVRNHVIEAVVTVLNLNN